MVHIVSIDKVINVRVCIDLSIWYAGFAGDHSIVNMHEKVGISTEFYGVRVLSKPDLQMDSRVLDTRILSFWETH